MLGLCASVRLKSLDATNKLRYDSASTLKDEMNPLHELTQEQRLQMLKQAARAKAMEQAQCR